MLKIRDGVDLKELEKYGAIFRYNENDGKINEIWFVDDNYKGTSWWFKLNFKKEKINKGILFKREYFIFKLELVDKHNFYNKVDLLYDLIKADLVEKVDD